MAMFSKQNMGLFGEHVCISSRPELFYEKVEEYLKLFLEILQNLKTTCAGISFLNEVAGWKPQTSKHPSTGFVFGEAFKNTYFVKHLRTAFNNKLLNFAAYLPSLRFSFS